MKTLRALKFNPRSVRLVEGQLMITYEAGVTLMVASPVTAAISLESNPATSSLLPTLLATRVAFTLASFLAGTFLQGQFKWSWLFQVYLVLPKTSKTST